MKTTFNVIESYDHSFVGILSMRISTAIDMFEFESKTHSHSEYQGPWDVFLQNIEQLLQDKSVNITIRIEYFKGITDMIIEIKVVVYQQDNKPKVHNINSEQILGTVLQELFNHFELKGWNRPSLEGIDKDQLEKLIVFKNN